MAVWGDRGAAGAHAAAYDDFAWMAVAAYERGDYAARAIASLDGGAQRVRSGTKPESLTAYLDRARAYIRSGGTKGAGRA